MDKRPLKAYVRYDGNGRIIPGSLILSRIKPKNGGYVQTPGYECCNDVVCTTVNYQVTITQANLDDATGNTGIIVNTPDGGTWPTTNSQAYIFNTTCTGGGSGVASAQIHNICANTTPVAWYFKNNAVVLINTIVNTGTPCTP